MHLQIQVETLFSRRNNHSHHSKSNQGNIEYKHKTMLTILDNIIEEAERVASPDENTNSRRYQELHHGLD